MGYRSSAASARRHPSATFGLVGGSFALLFVLAASLRELLDGRYAPSSVEAVLVGGGFGGGALLARLLWARLGGAESPLRGAAVGALIGLLALPVPMFLLELGVIAFEGMDFDPLPGASPWTRAASYAFVLVATPLALGALGIIPTRGGTILVGAVTGYLLARQ